jgi:hypothetical protein
MLRSWNSWRRLSLPAMLGTILFGASVLAVSAQTAGGDSGAGQSAITNQQAPDDGDLGPPWEREGFQCAPDADDPNGRGGPSWLCDHGGVLLAGADASDHPGKGRGRGQGGGVLGFTAGVHPGNGTPNWMRSDECNASDDGGRGGPPWKCGGDGVSALGVDGVEKGPAWMRSEHPGRGHGRGGDGA